MSDNVTPAHVLLAFPRHDVALRYLRDSARSGRHPFAVIVRSGRRSAGSTIDVLVNWMRLEGGALAATPIILLADREHPRDQIDGVIAIPAYERTAIERAVTSVLPPDASAAGSATSNIDQVP